MPRNFLPILDLFVWPKELLIIPRNAALINLAFYVRELAYACVSTKLLRRHDGEDAAKRKSMSSSKRMGID
jgi:hypothetical protein